MKDILARLEKGESVDDIATDLTIAINKANTEYEAKRKEKEKAVSRSTKIAAMDALLADLVDLLAAYEVEGEVLDTLEETDSAEIIDAIDESLPAIQKYMELMDAMRAPEPEPKQPVKGPVREPTKQDPIEEFLNKFVR
jgi:hypothetical protein